MRHPNHTGYIRKKGVNKQFVIVDGGMNALLRPALYQAHHKIENITSESEKLKFMM